VAPPRFRIAAPKGSLVFTSGGAVGREKVVGFRVYGTFHTKFSDKDQLVAVFDSETGRCKGLVLGELIGAMRTGAIGGVAIKYMANSDAAVLGILGSGLQARTQLEAASVVRKLGLVKVYSPTKTHRDSFAKEMKRRLGLNIIAVDSAQEAVGNSDILVCATTSNRPVFDSKWLKEGVHINSIGPNEIDEKTLNLCNLIATDSLAQLQQKPKPLAITKPSYKKIVEELENFVVGKAKSRSTVHDISLFCSMGLAGTEVVVANEAIRKLHKTKN
jgi:ornithine cyclodeaminase/alanine dehydrogenase-like protein (mu-crystallin family)